MIKFFNEVRIDEKSSFDFRYYFLGFDICRWWICSYKSWASKCRICDCAGNLDYDMFWFSGAGNIEDISV